MAKREPEPTAPRIRVKELRFVRAGDILPNDSNWRMHPPEQIEGYKAIVDSIGVADVLLTRETEDGRLMLYDGHMRRDVDPDVLYPTIVTDLTESEAEQALLVIDPLAAMAQTNADKLRALMERNNSDRPEIQRMMAELAERAGILGESVSNQPPEDFASYDENIETAYCCPKCGYRWSGKPNSDSDDV
jgi:hypothetical protein